LRKQKAQIAQYREAAVDTLIQPLDLCVDLPHLIQSPPLCSVREPSGKDLFA